MHDAHFWTQLADRFTALEPDPRYFQAESTDPPADGTRWRLSRHNTANAHFEALAGLALTALGDGDTSVSHWLDRVCRDEPQWRDDLTLERTRQRARQPGGRVTILHTGINHGSASLCRLLQVKADLAALQLEQQARTPQPSTKGLVRVQAEWFNRLVRESGETLARWAVLHGIDGDTAENLAAGKYVKRSTVRKVADQLRIDVSKIPTTS